MSRGTQSFQCLLLWMSVFYSLAECSSQNPDRPVNRQRFFGEANRRCVKGCRAPRALNCLSITVNQHLPGKEGTSPKEELPASHPANMTLQTQLLKTNTVHSISTWSLFLGPPENILPQGIAYLEKYITASAYIL